jgi:hypothetical protein
MAVFDEIGGSWAAWRIYRISIAIGQNYSLYGGHRF